LKVDFFIFGLIAHVIFVNDFRYWLLLFVIVISLTIFFSIGYYNALFGIFFSVIVTLLIFAVIMQHLNKKTSDLKKSTIAHNSMEELRSRLRISSVASSTFFARSDESSTAEASSTIELGSDTFYARSDDGLGLLLHDHGRNGYGLFKI